jgi:hypothetical protein
MRWLALLLFVVAAPVAAQSGSVTNVSTTANVKVLRPLQLTTLRNLDFGTIVIETITSNQIVSVNSSGRSCGSGGQLTCTGLFTTAEFQVTGTNNQVVTIRSATPTTILTNAAGQTLTLTPQVPPSLTLPNSGVPGSTFQVGGSLVITPTTPPGLYSGTIDIQVAYQ